MINPEEHHKAVQAKREDISTNPSLHRHDFNGLVQCCMVDGILVASLMDLHEEAIKGPNRGCDVTKGPCGCGAWH